MRNALFLFLPLLLVTCNRYNTENESHSEAYEALQFLGAQAAYPGVDIPDDAYGRAWDVLQSDFIGQERGGGAAMWQSLGPKNVGGRALCIAIHPTDTATLLVGSASGGLWRSTTGGVGLNAWQHVETGFDVHGVASVAYNPLNPQEIWIGTGETYDYGKSLNGLVVRTTRGSHGIGALRSTDGGLTWTKALDWSYHNQRTVWDLALHPTQSGTVYAATTEGVLKTTNAGASWTTVLDRKMVMDLALDPQNPDIVYAGVGNLTSTAKGVYKTTDAGTNWQRLSGGLPTTNTGRTTVTVYPSDPNIVYAHVCNDFTTNGLYKSINKGINWTLLTNEDLASYQGWYGECLHIRSNDSNRIWTGATYLWSSDDGANFQQETSFIPNAIDQEPWPDLHDLIENPKDPNKLYLLTDAGLYRSNNDGATWYWAAHGFNVSQFYTGSVSAQNPDFVIGGLQDRFTQLHNGQNNWIPIGGGDGTFNAIDPTDDQRYYVASQNLNMSGSLGGGLNGTPSPAFVAPFMLAPSNPAILYAGSRVLHRSDDYAFTWTESGQIDNGNPVLSMDVSRQNSQKVYVATAPRSAPPMKVFVTNNGGQSFTNITNGLPDRYPRDIAIDPQDDQTVYLALSGFGTPHLYKTTNGGQSWSALGANLPDVPFHTVLVHPLYPNLVWAGSDLGVFESSDSGTTWHLLGQGLPSAVFVFELEYSPSDHSLLAFTHGRGVYRLSLGNPTGTTQAHENQLIVYPTAFSATLHIQLSTPLTTSAVVSLIDASGKVVAHTNMAQGSERLDFDTPAWLLSGSYWLQLRAGNRVLVKRVLKV